MAAYLRMPSMAEMPPAAWDLAYLVDAAGGLDNAARLVGTDPGTLAGWLAGEPTAVLTLATRRLGAALAGRIGWSFTAAGPFILRSVA
jgi:hypothetical protein